ncbi:Subtilisin-like protease SBT4.6 [Euphorbia peplus]|nr:Subtilisin-like protease SBT4.6 [Euphorbia peplus]
MANMKSSLLQLILFGCLLVSCYSKVHGDRKAYIVYMGDRLKGDFSAAKASHTDILHEVAGSGASDFLLHSYHRSFNGFVAKLTKAEKQKLEGKEGVVSVFQSRKKQLHTTRSWDFMRFPLSVARSTNGSDVIIGMLDTGIWPEADSFRDEGFGPPPRKWKGTCQGNFTCNNKVIGARYYNSEGDLEPEDILSPRDTEGHGTHTASTAAGNIVEKASFLGLGEGIARGGLPSARLAVYKICWYDGCSDADILAAFDDAIADGVDIISLSVGGAPQYYFQDTIAIGAFHAMKNGVLTSNSAGNGGPLPETVSNFAPWALSVAASTIDRTFLSQVMLGNGALFKGIGLNTFDGDSPYRIIYGGDAPSAEGEEFGAMLCVPGNLNKTLVKGKIVLCDVSSDTEGVEEAGAAGTIMRVGDYKDIARAYDLPATSLSMSDQADIMEYLQSTSEPTATILRSGTFENLLAPVMASFSSRGPNPVTRDLIKPDLTAPGVNILAAWTEFGPAGGSKNKTVPFYIISGTSMSCPHASAAAAYVKSVHPTWSPDAIRSALMTTAYTMDVSSNPDAEFGYGSGNSQAILAQMTSLNSSFLCFILFCCCLISCYSTTDEDRKVYIVYMGDRPKGDFSATDFHTNILQEVVGSSASDVLLHSYHRSFNGFVANLTEAEKQKLEGKEGVVSVFRSRQKQLQTTRSWNFMSFPQNVTRSTYESDVIIGMFDTGIWPESESFNDQGFGPPPTKWKGVCQGNSNFTCNNKVIGARYYHREGKLSPEDIPSPRDSGGHGTHTSSIAAGGIVEMASFLGLASGTAQGGVPSARIAVYKICWLFGCSDADILAAFDDAIADGVDIISLSVAVSPPGDYFEDSIPIGSFHALKNGILTSNSAGNQGPLSETLLNFAPWALSVAASTIDRKFVSKVKLGNGAIYEGLAINTFDMENKMYPIIHGADAENTTNGGSAWFCSPGSLIKTLVEGKIVVCDDSTSGAGAIYAGAVGSIMRKGHFEEREMTYDLPASVISMSDEADILEYIGSTSEPTATILKSSEYKNALAPFVASFSSRGPNPVTRDIIKPDLTAPGMNIIAAWTEASPPPGSNNKIVPFYILSGTSMSCPHASGAAAYVKSFHPTWSPDAIKSALMTTAYTMNADTNPDAEFAYGSVWDDGFHKVRSPIVAHVTYP